MALEAMLHRDARHPSDLAPFLRHPRGSSSTLLGADGPSMTLESELTRATPNFSDPCELSAAPFADPASSLGEFLVDEAGREIKLNFDHGTTTLGFKYQGGTVLAVDPRATGGMYIGSGSVRKIIPINKFLLGKFIFQSKLHG